MEHTQNRKTTVLGHFSIMPYSYLCTEGETYRSLDSNSNFDILSTYLCNMWIQEFPELNSLGNHAFLHYVTKKVKKFCILFCLEEMSALVQDTGCLMVETTAGAMFQNSLTVNNCLMVETTAGAIFQNSLTVNNCLMVATTAGAMFQNSLTVNNCSMVATLRFVKIL